MGSAVLHTHILGLFPVRDLTVLGSRKVSTRENVNTIVSFWNLTGSPTALLPRRLPNFRAIGKFYRNVIENTTPSYRWTSMASCETCVWWVYLQCVSNGGCSHAYYILGLFPVRNLTVLGSRKVPSRDNVNTIASLWNLTGSSTALLPRRLPNFTAIGKFYGRSYDKTLELAAALLKKRLITWIAIYACLTKFHGKISENLRVIIKAALTWYCENIDEDNAVSEMLIMKNIHVVSNVVY